MDTDVDGLGDCELLTEHQLKQKSRNIKAFISQCEGPNRTDDGLK